MTAAIDIPIGERGRIRVFAINISAEDMRAKLAEAPKSDVARDLLAAPHLDTRSAEIFPVADLDGVGLAQYLIDGYEVPEQSLADHRAKLEQLDGYVLLLFSDSFGGAEATLATGADLTLIGAYAETLPDNRQRPVVTPSAAPYSGAPGPGAESEHRAMGGRVFVLLALGTALVLFLWLLN
ncbi:MAG: hypothetical protein AAF636_22455 [Pseudomonadota bacterium]